MRFSYFLVVFAFMAIGMLRSIGVYRLIPMEISVTTLTIAGLGGFFVLRNRPVSRSQIIVVAVFAGLCVYSIIFSRFPGLSGLMSYFMLASSLVFVSLYDADEVYARNYEKSPDINALSDAAKLAFIVFASFHAISLLFFYLFIPLRTTGLMDDYSQSSMLLLCAYAMAYPRMKDKVYFTALSALFFTAFFTTFSRTANFLLIIFFVSLLILEWRNNNVGRIVKLGFIALVGLAFVYWYPSIMGETAVDRGGLAHFSNLNSRTIYWEAAWQAIKQAPFFGHGIGTYSYTGINEAQPFNIILYVHNDYLQIWHDLGILWLIALVGTLAYLLLKFTPVMISVTNGRPSLYFTSNNERRYLAWTLIACIAMYMGINFLITSIEFQVAIAIFVADLFKK